MDSDAKHAVEEAERVLHDLMGYLKEVGDRSPTAVRQELAGLMDEMSGLRFRMQNFLNEDPDIVRFQSRSDRRGF